MSTMDSSDKPINLQLLQTLNKERSAFGIREKDHTRYRKHCASKLAKLRTSTGLKHGTSRNYKSTAPISAAGVKDGNFLLTLVFEAERSVAHAHELSAAAGADETNAQDRRAQVSKLRRAQGFASQLYDISQDADVSSRLSARARTEIAVFHLGIQSELAFQRHQWDRAVSGFVVRRKLLAALSDEATTSAERVLADEEMDGSDPLIRFCAYKLGRGESHDVDGIVRDFDDEAAVEILPSFSRLLSDLSAEAKSAKAASGMTSWNGELAPGVQVRHLELVQPMMRAQQAMEALESKSKAGKSVKSMKLWDKVLTNLGEAEDISRRLAAAEQNAGSQGSSSVASLAHQHILQLLLLHRIRRDNILLRELQTDIPLRLPPRKDQFILQARREDSAKSLTAMVKLYDGMIQGTSAMLELGIVAEDHARVAGLDATEAYLRAQKCHALGLLHSIMPTVDHPSIIRLCEQARNYLGQAHMALQTKHTLPLPEVLGEGKRATERAARSIGILETWSKQAWMPTVVAKRNIYDVAFNHIELPTAELEAKAGRRSSQPAEVKQPAKAQAVPPAAKPLHVAPPQPEPARDVEMKSADEDEEQEEEEEQTEAPKKSGWFGGLWGGRK